MDKPQFQFRALTERDLPLLFEWLNRPHVAEWWDGPVSLTAVRETYLPILSTSSRGVRARTKRMHWGGCPW